MRTRLPINGTQHTVLGNSLERLEEAKGFQDTSSHSEVVERNLSNCLATVCSECASRIMYPCAY